MLWQAPGLGFVPVQRVPTDGAHGAELFRTASGSVWLAVANFGDRLGQRYAAESPRAHLEDCLCGRCSVVVLV